LNDEQVGGGGLGGIQLFRIVPNEARRRRCIVGFPCTLGASRQVPAGCRRGAIQGILNNVTTLTLDSPSLGQNDTANPTKRVLLLKPRGFCAGVVRAIDIVQIALETFGAPIYVRKEIVHNSYVVTDLAKKGAIFVNELDEVPEGARVIYSAHGVSPAVRQHARERNLKVIDATCPL
jgi:4-hydroxy-3-methylbut-2-enyl diphosphate reductase